MFAPHQRCYNAVAAPRSYYGTSPRCWRCFSGLVRLSLLIIQSSAVLIRCGAYTVMRVYAVSGRNRVLTAASLSFAVVPFATNLVGDIDHPPGDVSV